MFNRGFVSLFSGSVAIAMALVSLLVMLLAGPIGMETDNAMRGVSVPLMIVVAIVFATSFIKLGTAELRDQLRVLGPWSAIVFMTLLMLVPSDGPADLGSFVLNGVVALMVPFLGMFMVPERWLPIQRRWAFILSTSVPVIGTHVAWELGLRSMGSTNKLLGTGFAVAVIVICTLTGLLLARVETEDQDAWAS